MFKVKGSLCLALLTPVLVLHVDILTYDVVCRKSTMQEDGQVKGGKDAKTEI